MTGKINVELIADPNTEDVSFKFSGSEELNFTENDLTLFKINEVNLKVAFQKELGVLPTRIHLRPPAPWFSEDIFKKYNLKPVAKVLTVKSVKLLNFVKKPVIVSKQNFENDSDATVKVNTGLSRSVKNTLKTCWTNEQDLLFNHDFEYNVGFSLVKLHGTAEMKYTRNWGSSEDKSEDVIIGTNSGVEIELSKGQAVTAVLSSDTVEIEAEVTYAVSLRHTLVAVYNNKLNGHHIDQDDIDVKLRECGVSNEVSVKEIIKFNYNVEGSLKVSNRTPDVSS